MPRESMPTIPARAARAIEMSPTALTKWQAVLIEKNIGTASELLDKLTESISEPKARQVLRGERTDKKVWESIFRDLDLKMGDFFTAAQLYGEVAKPWELLWELAEDASDRFGAVYPDPLQQANIRNAIPSSSLSRYMTELPLNAEVVFELPSGLSGHLILLEHNSFGKIDLVSPSPLMQNTLLTGEVRLLPQRPVPEGYAEKIKLTDEGTRHLWAGIFDRLPEWDWLADVQDSMRCDLKIEQLNDLLAYAKQQPSGTPIWRSSYTVVKG
jgi:hypothetical protein